MNTENRKSKLVFDMRVCRALLKKDMHVIDCKPLKSDKSKTVLVFEDTPEFEEALAEIIAEYKLKDDAKKEPTTDEVVDPIVMHGWN